MTNDDLSEEGKEFLEFAESHLLFDDAHQEHLPIPVFSYIRPTMGTQFLLQLLLSLGRYVTALDLLQHATLRELFWYAKLIGSCNDK